MGSEPQPGDIGLAYSNSKIGRWIRMAQAAIGDWAPYSHAFIVLHDGLIIEATPKGAQIVSLENYQKKNLVFSKFDLTPEQRNKIVEEAVRMEGIGYNFLDYLYLGLKRLGLPYGWVERRLQRPDRMICSQLCAEAYKRAGLTLCDDCQPYEITPGDLARIFLEYDGKDLYRRG